MTEPRFEPAARPAIVAKPPLVPEGFAVPLEHATSHLLLRKLTAADADADYEALMASAPLVRAMFGRDWPRDGFTREENLAHLVAHEAEFDARVAFAYSVKTLDGETCLGCVYLNRPRDRSADVRVYLWARPDRDGLDALLFREVNEWLRAAWPFERVLFPGRRADGSWFPL